MAEINCETDFVARTDLFLEFSRRLVATVGQNIKDNLEITS